eukprot:5974939-Amphidinium_carterae.1
MFSKLQRHHHRDQHYLLQTNSPATCGSTSGLQNHESKINYNTRTERIRTTTATTPTPTPTTTTTTTTTTNNNNNQQQPTTNKHKLQCQYNNTWNMHKTRLHTSSDQTCTQATAMNSVTSLKQRCSVIRAQFISRSVHKRLHLYFAS